VSSPGVGSERAAEVPAEVPETEEANAAEEAVSSPGVDSERAAEVPAEAPETEAPDEKDDAPAGADQASSGPVPASASKLEAKADVPVSDAAPGTPSAGVVGETPVALRKRLGRDALEVGLEALMEEEETCWDIEGIVDE
jgi:hypothetical protein